MHKTLLSRPLAASCAHVPRFVSPMLLLSVALVIACGSDSTGPNIAAGSSLVLTTAALPPLDAAREGGYAIWMFDASDSPHFAGRFTPGGSVTFASPVADPRSVAITVERPGTVGAEPAAQVLLRGAIRGGRASLVLAGAVTQGGLPLHQRPGQFTMFTPSDNGSFGYPSHEESGVWLFNMRASTTEQNDFYVRMTQLQAGWIYEGWMVRDLGSAHEVWLSYGKFLPDWTGTVNSPDDSGWGPFSGVTDYLNSRLEDFPGDDYISNPLHLPFPAELTLPLNFREKDSGGKLRWSHVVTIEPVSDKGEPIGSERPFFLRPYIDGFGDLNPGIPRTITFRPELMPSATVEIR